MMQADTQGYVPNATRSAAIAALGIVPRESRVLVVGLGLTGFSVIRFLSGLKIDVAITDNRRNPPYLAELQSLSADIPVFLGRYDRLAFKAATHLFVSPEVSLDTEEIFQALESGLPLLSDIDLFALVMNAPVAGITGSNSKSTVTSVLGTMAMQADIEAGSIPNATRSAAMAALGIVPRASRVLVVGLGLTGFSVARFLSGLKIDVAITDNRRNPPCLAQLQSLSADIPVFLGSYDRKAFKAATHLVVSPGVSLDTEEVFEALESGLPLLSDIDLFASVVNAPVVGITGSNGKSTVTSLLGTMAKSASWKARVGGNLGVPALDLLDDDEGIDLYVLELSSFQLERTSLLKCAAATVLNISPDHMDRHGDLETYARAKQSIFSNSTVMVLNQDDPRVAAMAKKGQPTQRFGLSAEESLDFSLRKQADGEWLVHRGNPLIRTDCVKIGGRQNLSNALAALALGHAVGLPMAAMLDGLQVFPGLPHRMQWVEKAKGVTWINDSKATNVGACIAAIEGLNGKIVLIAGGDGKGADFSVLKNVIKEKARAVVLIGRDADLLYALLASDVTSVKAPDLRRAVELSAEFARPGDTVLLSPACASLDQFRDYQERGKVFEQAVRELIGAH